MDSPIWQIQYGDGPLVAAATHDGHAVRQDLAPLLALDDDQRLREEDPFTGMWTAMAPTRIVGLRSRFEVDLNRPRDECVYLQPKDAWGLNVWNQPLPEDFAERSRKEHDAFYRQLHAVLASALPSPSQNAAQQEQQVVLAELLESLPAEYRQVIILRNLQGLSHSEVARCMDKSVGAARMLWVRALQALRQKFPANETGPR